MFPHRRAALVAFSVCLGGCGGGAEWLHDSTNVGTTLSPLALVDVVDYAVLGQGRICFERVTVDRPGGGVFVIDATAHQVWGIATAGAVTGRLFYEPAISPDGTRIAYSSLTDFVTFWDIYEIPAEGGFPERVSGGAENERLPVWTRDSQLLWLGSEGYPTSGLRDTREATSVTGARVVAVHGSSSRSGLLIREASAYRLLLASPDGDTFAAPAFSPDGAELAWIHVRGPYGGHPVMDVVVARANSDAPEIVTSFPLSGGLLIVDGGNNLSLDWAPDGRRLVFNLPETNITSHIFMVGRDGTGLQQITSAPGVVDRSVSWSHPPTS